MCVYIYIYTHTKERERVGRAGDRVSEIDNNYTSFAHKIKRETVQIHFNYSPISIIIWP